MFQVIASPIGQRLKSPPQEDFIIFLSTDYALSSALLSSGKALSSGQNPASRQFLFSKSSQ